ncbi:GINS complex protein [Actinidia rufa]|uniref:GINS complex protein n=1 Tax=Actinidia rufa TaxID=165716 RepID=A0A7J0HF06_9ERIC|nr:GINS complex protein [Actinidia rufa]
MAAKRPSLRKALKDVAMEKAVAVVAQEDLLAQLHTLVPAVFQVAANGVGLFDSSDETNKVTLRMKQLREFLRKLKPVFGWMVEQGSKVELPFWLARELHLRQAVSINLPPCFNQNSNAHRATNQTRVTWSAEWSGTPYPMELDMVGVGFFGLLARVGDKTIALLLLAAFQTRYKEVLIKAQTAAMTVAPKFLTLLTKEETKLYEAAQSSMASFKKWRMGGPRFQRASVLGRKRRPSD